MLKFYMHESKNKKLSKISLQPSGATIIRRKKYTPKVKITSKEITDKYMAKLCFSNVVLEGSTDINNMFILQKMANIAGVKHLGKAKSMYVTNKHIIYSNRHILVKIAIPKLPLTDKHTAIVEPEVLELFRDVKTVDFYYYDKNLIIKSKDVIALVPFKMQRHLHLEKEPEGEFIAVQKKVFLSAIKSIKKADKKNTDVIIEYSDNVLDFHLGKGHKETLEIAYLKIAIDYMHGKIIHVRLGKKGTKLPVLTIEDEKSNSVNIAHKRKSK